MYVNSSVLSLHKALCHMPCLYSFPYPTRCTSSASIALRAETLPEMVRLVGLL
jgi:hypothetical protein